MALIVASSRCAICGELRRERDPFFATSGCAVEPDHLLWRFCDAPMHWSCYASWPDRPAFARAYFERDRAAARRNPYWGIVHIDDDVLVMLNPSARVCTVSISVAALGCGPRIPLAQWSDWLRRPTPQSERGEIERDAVEEARLRLQYLPDAVDALAARAVFPDTRPPDPGLAAGARKIVRTAAKTPSR
jgi:hypothetical protein